MLRVTTPLPDMASENYKAAVASCRDRWRQKRAHRLLRVSSPVGSEILVHKYSLGQFLAGGLSKRKPSADHNVSVVKRFVGHRDLATRADSKAESTCDWYAADNQAGSDKELV